MEKEKAEKSKAEAGKGMQAMRERIFQDPEAKRQLEAIIHPLVSQITAEQAQHALDTGHRCLVFDVPLLVESGERWRRQVDRVLVIDCDPQGSLTGFWQISIAGQTPITLQGETGHVE